MWSKLFLLLIPVLLLPVAVFSQKVIEGNVTNAQTGEPLPAANIVIEDVYLGTVSNSNGFYRLSIPDSLLPAAIEVSYIGFYSETRIIKQNSPREQNFSLKPSVAQLEELTVTAKAEDLTVMERVIRRKQQWRKKLHSYKAEAYSRRILKNDTSIVSIGESVTAIYWREELGTREVLKWREQTANIEVGQNLAGVRYLHNLYDDNIEIAGYKMAGITHPEAMRYYDFEVIDLLSINGQKVYKIKVTPDKILQPLFKGVAFVLDEAFSLLKVDLSPNEVVRFPVPIKDFQFNYKQQYNNFGGSIWLPVNIRVQGEVKIEMLGLEFPRMKFSQIANITDYEVNIALPDSLFDDEVITIDSTIVADSIFAKTVERIPLSPKEERAYATIDSTDTVEEAFEPSGFLAKFIEFSAGAEASNDDPPDSAGTDSGFNIGGSFSPRLRFNRVDGLYGGLIYTIDPIERLEFEIEGGYSTGYDEWSYGGGMELDLTDGRISSSVGVFYRAATAPRYSSFIFDPTMTSFVNLLGYPNYFDYFRNEGVKAYAHFADSQSDLSLQVTYLNKEQTSLTQETGYDIFGRDQTIRPNPAINEGHLASLKMKLSYNLYEGYSFGITGLKRAALSVEHASDALGGDFNFTRYRANLFWNFETFLQRRLFPNKLYIRLMAGTFSGRLPLQKMGIVDVAEGAFSPFGVLRATRFRPFEGEQYIAFFAEHNFRTVPFELLGLDWVADRSIGVIVFGGIARTWVSEERLDQIMARTAYTPKLTDGFNYEAGVSLSGILNLFRVDFAFRLDEPAFLIGVGLTRFL